MREIKTKPEGNPKILDTAARVPKSALKALWLKSKEKGVSELKETPFFSQKEETSNAPANTAGDQMLSGMETAAKKGANLAWRGGKKLAQDTARKIKEKRELSRAAETLRDTGIRRGRSAQMQSGISPRAFLPPGRKLDPFRKRENLWGRRQSPAPRLFASPPKQSDPPSRRRSIP